MSKIKEVSYEILDVSKKIYQFKEQFAPNAIFRDKIFLIGTEDDRNAVSVIQDYEKNDCSYYFETLEIDGVIIKRQHDNYCVKACVKYTDGNDRNLWFAKIRIETSDDGVIKIMGARGGSWQQPDCEDENLITNPNSDFPIALDSMKNYLVNIYNQLCNNSELNSDLYDPAWVKKLKKYNN